MVGRTKRETYQILTNQKTAAKGLSTNNNKPPIGLDQKRQKTTKQNNGCGETNNKKTKPKKTKITNNVNGGQSL